MKARLPDGYGKQNVNALMQQAQEMQELMQAKQEELKEQEMKASAGGGLVEVTLRGDYTVTAVRIKPELATPDDLEMLEDMVGAAFNEGVRMVNEKSEKEMEAISGAFPGLANLGL